MDPQTLINIAAGGAIAVASWFCKSIWDAVNELKDDIHRIEVELPINYVRKDEFFENMKEIKDMLRQIFDKLDGKVDKHWGEK
jgi:hypothetical protein